MVGAGCLIGRRRLVRKIDSSAVRLPVVAPPVVGPVVSGVSAVWVFVPFGLASSWCGTMVLGSVGIALRHRQTVPRAPLRSEWRRRRVRLIVAFRNRAHNCKRMSLA